MTHTITLSPRDRHLAGLWQVQVWVRAPPHLWPSQVDHWMVDAHAETRATARRLARMARLHGKWSRTRIVRLVAG